MLHSISEAFRLAGVWISSVLHTPITDPMFNTYLNVIAAIVIPVFLLVIFICFHKNKKKG